MLNAAMRDHLLSVKSTNVITAAAPIVKMAMNGRIDFPSILFV